MPQGRVTPGQGTRYDTKPWQPGCIIGERFGRPVAISFAAVRKLPDYQSGMVRAATDANMIIHNLLGANG